MVEPETAKNHRNRSQKHINRVSVWLVSSWWFWIVLVNFSNSACFSNFFLLFCGVVCDVSKLLSFVRNFLWLSWGPNVHLFSSCVTRLPIKPLSPKQSFSDVKSMQGTTGIKIDAVEPEISSSFIPHITLSWQNLAPALPTMQHNHWQLFQIFGCVSSS